MLICAQVWACVCECVYVHEHMSVTVYVPVCMYMCVHICVYVWCTHVCMCAHKYVCVYLCVRACMCMCVCWHIRNDILFIQKEHGIAVLFRKMHTSGYYHILLIQSDLERQKTYMLPLLMTHRFYIDNTTKHI